MAHPGPILIVDDEASIRKSLEGVLSDEGYSCALASDGADALSRLESLRPSLVILDIWMPGMDGIETLRRMKAMATGYARDHDERARDDIDRHQGDQGRRVGFHRETARTRCRAERDSSRARDTGCRPESRRGDLDGSVDLLSEGGMPELQPLVFGSQTMPGALIPQRTLARSAVLYGQGLHSGRKSGLIFEPLGPDSGIHFAGVSDNRAVPAHLDFVESTGWATTIRLGTTHVATIEHVMSALNAYGVSNLLIKCNGEVPVLDGSSVEFCSLFEEVGFENQIGEWRGSW